MARSEHFLSVSLKFLVVAALAEFTLVRIFSRMGMILPKTETVFLVYNSLTFLGSASFNFAAVLAVILLLLAAYSMARGLTKIGKLTAALVAAIIGISILSFLAIDPILSLLYDLTILAIFVLLAKQAFANGNSETRNLLVILVVVTYAFSYYFKIATTLAQSAAATPASARVIEMFNLGEASALLGSVMVFAFALRSGARHRAGYAVLAGAVTLLFSLAYVGNPWITAIITTWTTGFTLYLPFPAYALALFLFIYGVGMISQKERIVAYGLILVFLAGRALQLTYLNLLAVLGVLLVSNAIQVSGGNQSSTSSLTE